MWHHFSSMALVYQERFLLQRQDFFQSFPARDEEIRCRSCARRPRGLSHRAEHLPFELLRDLPRSICSKPALQVWQVEAEFSAGLRLREKRKRSRAFLNLNKI